MTSGCSDSLVFPLFLLTTLNFLSPLVECNTTTAFPRITNPSNDLFTRLVRNTTSSTKSSPISTASNRVQFLTEMSTAPISTATSSAQFKARTLTTPTVAKTDCFHVTNVTHSSITVQSNKSLKLNFDKCTGVRSSYQKYLVVGSNLFENLEACTTYRLHADQQCSLFVETSYIAPVPVAYIGTSVSNGTMNITWHSNNATTNCISHFEVMLLNNTNIAKVYKSRLDAEYYTVSNIKPGKTHFSVTIVDTKGLRTSSDTFEIVVRENSAVVTNRTKSLTVFSHNVQPLCETCDNALLNKSKRGLVARNGTRGFDPCLFLRREYLQLGSEFVKMRSNFTCRASKCSVECCAYYGTGKCEPNSLEEWTSPCAPREDGGTTIAVNGNRLRRKTVYSCTITVATIYRAYTQLDTFTTKNGRPAPPGHVWATNVTPTGFLISWAPSPDTDKDPVDYYILTVEPEKPSYRSRPDCQYQTLKRVFNISGGASTRQTVNGLWPYYTYKIYVDAYNSFGSTQNIPQHYHTQPSVPGSCENNSMIYLGANSSIDNPMYQFYWSEPCFWNAPPVDTVIKISGKRPDNPNKTSFHEEHFHNIRNTYILNASRDFVYTVEIFATVETLTYMKRCAGPWIISVPPGLSSVSNKWLKIRPEVLIPDEGGPPLVAIPLHQNLLDDSNGTIKHVALMVAQKGQQGERERTFLELPNWPNTRSWYEAMAEDSVLLYQATPKYWSLPQFDDNVIHAYNLGSDNCFGNETDRKRRSVNDVIIDDQANRRIGSISAAAPNLTGSEVDEVVYCNGPLRKNIEYVVRLRVFTSAGYTDSEDLYFRTGHSSSEWTPFYDHLWFYGIFPVFLASVLLSTMWIRKNRKWTNAVASAPSSDMIDSGGRPNRRRPCSRRRSISPQKLPVVAARLLAHKCILEKEFEDLNEISAEWAAKVPCTVGLMKENRLKNRYADVVPYDYNRVKLSSESTSQTDYINASFVKGFTMDTEYIACQGPTVETSNDFWQMVFDQNVCFIVMLTSLVENGMAKCSQYFSELSEHKEWMDFTVKCSSRLDLSNYTVRELQLYKRTNCEKRFIQHFQFRDWPDFGCPRDIDGILEFCDVLRGNLCLRGDSKTVVHCSAGIGRTGTLIALDILLQFVHYNRKLDIMRTVLRLREQRQWMVRTADQYAFLYRCLKTAAERHFSSES